MVVQQADMVTCFIFNTLQVVVTIAKTISWAVIMNCNGNSCELQQLNDIRTANKKATIDQGANKKQLETFKKDGARFCERPVPVGLRFCIQSRNILFLKHDSLLQLFCSLYSSDTHTSFMCSGFQINQLPYGSTDYSLYTVQERQ